MARAAAVAARGAWDAIVVGGGHNGLAAAAYLGARGLRAVVLERRPVIGGAAITEEIVPGFRFSRASYLAGLLRPRVIKELELEGIEYLARDPSSFTPSHPDDPLYGGRSLTLGSDAKLTAASISQFSQRDVAALEGYEAMLAGVRSLLSPLIDTPLPELGCPRNRAELRHLLRLAREMAPHLSRQVALDTYEVLVSPAATILDRWFESEMLKTTLATDSVIGAIASPYNPGSGYVLLHHVMGEIDNRPGVWAYVRGGMGAISKSIAAAAQKRGVAIETDCSVKEILLDSATGKASGVRLEDGSVMEAPVVISACNPYHTFVELAPTSRERSPAFVERISHLDHACGAFKINLALDRLPDFACCPNTPEDIAAGGGPQHRGTIHFVNRMSQIQDAYLEASRGVPATHPVIEMTIPTALDKSLVDTPGSHVAQLFVQFAPYELDATAGSWDGDLKQRFVDRVLSIVEHQCPGFTSSIVGVDALSPLDLERIFGLHRGNIFHGALSLHQLGFARPAPGFARHRSPVPGLYMASAGTHPGGGVSGACGRNCAQVVLDDLGIA